MNHAYGECENGVFSLCEDCKEFDKLRESSKSKEVKCGHEFHLIGFKECDGPENSDDLVNRLRGIYTFPEAPDGFQPSTRRFGASPINLEAANRIEKLNEGIKAFKEELTMRDLEVEKLRNGY